MTADAVPVPAAPRPPGSSQPFRYFVVLGVVLMWMILGWWLQLSPNAYLLLGVPLLVLFQLGVARRPLSEVWVRPASPQPFPLWGYVVAGGAMAVPVVTLARLWDRSDWLLRLFFFCAIAGAVPLAFAVTRFTRETLKSLLWCLATGGVLGVGYMLLMASIGGRLHDLSIAKLVWGSQQFLIYLTVGFVVEEVFFRGGLDSYLHRPGDKLPWLSATFLSVLWGWWHLPITPVHDARHLVGLAIFFPLVHMMPGIPFSFFWRRSGSLLVPNAVHAFIDAVRNVFMH